MSPPHKVADLSAEEQQQQQGKSLCSAAERYHMTAGMSHHPQTKPSTLNPAKQIMVTSLLHEL